jgi:hypothetical protein
MQSPAAVTPIDRLAAILRLDMPPARSLSTSRILRMGNLCPGMPCSPQRSRGNADSKITQRRWSHPSTAWSRAPGMVVAINRNARSQSIGIGGRISLHFGTFSDQRLTLRLHVGASRTSFRSRISAHGSQVGVVSRNSPFPFIPTCRGTPAGSSSRTTATTPAPFRPISATDRSCPRGGSHA